MKERGLSNGALGVDELTWSVGGIWIWMASLTICLLHMSSGERTPIFGHPPSILGRIKAKMGFMIS